MEKHARAIVSDEGYVIITCWFCPFQFVKAFDEDVEPNPMKELRLGNDLFVCCDACYDRHMVRDMVLCNPSLAHSGGGLKSTIDRAKNT